MKHRTYVKLISLLFAWVVLFLGLYAPSEAPPLAKAETPKAGSYACILEDNVFFYASANESAGLFLLPKTYYVGLLEYGGEYCRVEYLYDDAQTKRLVGYAKTALLTFVDYIPVRPYYSCAFELNYRIDEDTHLSSDFLTQITLSCTYYGDYKVGSKSYCYVLRGDSFGYVPKPADLYVKENTEYADYLKTLEPDSTVAATSEEKSSSPAQIAILVALCLLVPVLAALILKPPRRPPYETEE